MTPTESLTSQTATNVLQRAKAFQLELKRLSIELLNDDELDRAQNVMTLLQKMKEMEDDVHDVIEGKSLAANTWTKVVRETKRQFGPRKNLALNPDDYPRHVRRGNTLVRIGLKRDGSDTYEQKMSRERFEMVRNALIERPRERREFEPQEIIDLTGFPSYVVYLFLGLLQKQDYVTTPSKGMYRLRKNVDASIINDVWNSVPPEEHD